MKILTKILINKFYKTLFIIESTYSTFTQIQNTSSIFLIIRIDTR